MARPTAMACRAGTTLTPCVEEQAPRIMPGCRPTRPRSGHGRVPPALRSHAPLEVLVLVLVLVLVRAPWRCPRSRWPVQHDAGKAPTKVAARTPRSDRAPDLDALAGAAVRWSYLGRRIAAARAWRCSSSAIRYRQAQPGRHNPAVRHSSTRSCCSVDAALRPCGGPAGVPHAQHGVQHPRSRGCRCADRGPAPKGIRCSSGPVLACCEAVRAAGCAAGCQMRAEAWPPYLHGGGTAMQREGLHGEPNGQVHAPFRQCS